MERLPADVLYEISTSLTSNAVTLKDKYNNAAQIINLCKTNKRFNQIYCSNNKIWKELWQRDIGGRLPNNVREKYLNILQELQNKSMDDIILYSSKNGYLQLVKYSLANGGRIIQEDYDEENEEWLREENIMNIAIHNGQLEIVQYLLQQKEIKGSLSYYLREAAIAGQREIADYLIGLGADIHDEYDRIMPLTAQEGQVEMFKYLLQLGGDIHAWSDNSIRAAVATGQVEMVKFLVNEGINLNGGNMIWAARNGHLEMVKYLQSQGVDIHYDNDKPLEYAAIDKRKKIVEYLLANGANPNNLSNNIAKRNIRKMGIDL